MRVIAAVSCISIVLFLSACGSNAGSAPAPAGGGKRVDAATAGTVNGRVTFEGAAPAPQPLRMTSDEACVEAAGPNPMNDAVVINDGGIQNVFVYVKAGLDPAYSFDAPTNVLEFDQRGCRYLPRVFGVRAGQTFEVLNDDKTLHNVHALPKANREFNHSMPLKGQRRKYRFDAPEVMVRFKCDVHAWMTAYVGVMAHPFFAVTNADGTFDISGLPPGTYTLEAWHERFGTQAQTVTVGDRQTQTVSFTFRSS